MIGVDLGHYRVLERLGSGGMGEAYLAEDTTLERKVALKVRPAELASRPRSAPRPRPRLRHPHRGESYSHPA